MHTKYTSSLLLKIWAGFIIFGAVSVTGYALRYFSFDVLGVLKLHSESIAESTTYRLCFYVHILGGIVAIMTGPLQFWSRFRNRNLKLHRRVGYVYFYSVLFSGLFGIPVAILAYGGPIAAAGFLALDVGWLLSTGYAIKKAVGKDIRGHQKWMQRSFAFTFTAVTFRIWLVSFPLLGFCFLHGYQIAAWLPWILNLLILECWRRSSTSSAGRLIPN